MNRVEGPNRTGARQNAVGMRAKRPVLVVDLSVLASGLSGRLALMGPKMWLNARLAMTIVPGDSDSIPTGSCS